MDNGYSTDAPLIKDKPLVTPYNSIPSIDESNTPTHVHSYHNELSPSSLSSSSSPSSFPSPSSAHPTSSLSSSSSSSTNTTTPTKQHLQCEKYLQKSLSKKNGLVRYMLDSLADSGCIIDDSQIHELIKCIPCTVKTHGAMYYDVDPQSGALNGNVGIAMCENKISNQKEFNTVLTHELIHVYDHCRAQVDYHTNPYHHACTEIRAANLSGDCTFLNELRRGYFRVTNHHNECVKRRAIISVASNPIAGPEKAERYVNSVWHQCIRDLKPFGSIPWQ